MRMYPFWKLDGEGDSIYQLRGFSGFVAEPGGERGVLYIFDGMNGELTEARPSKNIRALAQEADSDEVRRLHPEEWEEWRSLPEEDL
jgi:hypothetical protein